MRKILFRGKERDTGEWKEGLLLYDESYEPAMPVIVHFGDWIGGFEWRLGFTFVLPETVGQYIGVKDINGTPIYEGDIVETKHGRLVSIEWFSSPAHLCWDMKPCRYLNGRPPDPPDTHDLYLSENLKVVGNLYDNPELLEVNRL